MRWRSARLDSLIKPPQRSGHILTSPLHLVVDARSACRLSKDGDVLRVSTERADVPVNPGDGSVLVPQTVVSCRRHE